MKIKNLLILLMIFFVSIETLYAKNSYYTIQLAAVKESGEGLNYLTSKAKNLNNKLLREVRVVTNGKYYILFALITTSELKAKGLLPEYKKVFKDAYIRKHDPSKVELIKSYKSNKQAKPIEPKLATQPKQTVESKIEKPANNGLKFTNDMLVNHTIYALYTKKDAKKDIALVALELLNDFTMNFQVVLGEKHRGEGSYFIDFQGRFYLYSDENHRYKSYYTLVEKNRHYMLVNAWEDGEKDDNEVRFFYSISHAKRYIDTIIKR